MGAATALLGSALAALGGCDAEPDRTPDYEAPPRSVSVRPVAVPEIVDRPPSQPDPGRPPIRPDSLAPRRPPEPYVDRGVCPFECCTYRDWTAREPLRAFRAPRDRSAEAFALARGESFDALTGDVYIDTVGVVRVDEPVPWMTEPDSIGRFEPGDTVYVLSYRGEATYNLWHRGRVVQVANFWAPPPSPMEPPARGTLVRKGSKAHWWVRIRNAGG